jgi:hypothetical protein
MEQCWLACPACGAPLSLLCAIHGPHPTDLILLDQNCACDHLEAMWLDVWRNAQRWLQAQTCSYPDDTWPDVWEQRGEERRGDEPLPRRP